MTRDPQRILGRVGINVDRSGSDDLAAIRALGFDGIRVPVTIADPSGPVPMPAYGPGPPDPDGR